MKYTFQLLRDRIKIKKTTVVLSEIVIGILFYHKIKFLELS